MLEKVSESSVSKYQDLNHFNVPCMAMTSYQRPGRLYNDIPKNGYKDQNIFSMALLKI